MFNIYDLLIQGLIAITDFAFHAVLGGVVLLSLPFGLDTQYTKYAMAFQSIVWPILSTFDMRILLPCAIGSMVIAGLRTAVHLYYAITGFLKNIPGVGALFG